MNKPPRWADRFLEWYCNPELLEEIQGDAHELYNYRVENEGRRSANFRYIWDVMRFLRLSNVRRTEEFNEGGFFGTFWNINMKMAIRNSKRNVTVFLVKLSALAICLAFTFLLAAFVITELTYDHQHDDYDRIYRISSKVDIQGKTSSYAISPLPMAAALVEEVPGVERATHLMTYNLPYQREDEQYFGIKTCLVDSNYLRMFHFDYIEGSVDALDEPNRIVITASVAKRLFNDVNVMGNTIDVGMHTLEIGAVIKDLPLNTHFIFSAFMSWNTVIHAEPWDDFNAFTYIKTSPGVDVEDLRESIKETVDGYIELVSEEYGMIYEPIINRVDDIHLNGYLDEDFAPKRNRDYVYIILSVIVLFLLTGLFNYLNLALAELTTQVKKIAILRTFGGISADHRKVAITDAILCLIIVAPMVLIIMKLVLMFPGSLPAIEPNVWTSTTFLSLVAGLIVLILVCASLNSFMISKSELLLSPLKGSSVSSQRGFTARKFLVAAQLSFSIIMIGLITVIVDQFQYVNENDKGFDDHDVLVIKRRGSFQPSLAFEEELRGMAGVKMVAGASFFPEQYIEKKDLFEVETATGAKKILMNFILCESDYPKLLELRLKEGRLFDPQRVSDSRGGAFIINETAAKEFGWDKPIGKRINNFLGGESVGGEVIGVVEDFHFESMHSRIEPLLLLIGSGEYGINFIYIKTEPIQPPSLLAAIEEKHNEMFEDIPFEYDYLDAHYRGLYKHDYEIREIFQSGLIISIIVSALGIFSMSALLLSLKQKEMGIRKVVGAANLQLFLMHLRPFVVFFLIAIAIGLPVVFFLSEKWLNNFAYHIDLSVNYFILPGIVTVLIIFTASLYHAIRNARVNPVDILKND